MITAILCTARKDPKFKYMADSIAVSLSRCAHPFELIVVDTHLWHYPDEDAKDFLDKEAARRADLMDAINNRFSFRHLPPKPNAWQGQYRKTHRDYSDHNGARNTGLALARGGYIVFVDDCIAVDKDWYTWHYRAAVAGTAVAGAYKSYENAVVENGQIVSGTLCSGQDHRLEVNGPTPKQVGGGWFYGLACGAPLKYLLKVNGFDEIYAGQAGSDDLCLGLRIERAGCKIFYTPECFVYQIMETHESICGNEASGWPKGPDKQKELQLRSGRVAYANEMLIQNLFDDPDRIGTVGNDFVLSELRAIALATGMFPIERAIEIDWRDGARLENM